MGNLKSEIVQTLEDLSQYLRFQKGLGNREFLVSPDAKAVMDKWGTQEWRCHGFACQGPKSSTIMVIDSESSFFTGPAGELLIKILKAMHLSPTGIFICNPADLSRIRNHVQTYTPKCILCLGQKAGHLLLNRRDPLEEFRGQFLSFENTPLMATHHPLALLEEPGLKRQVWDDVQQVMARTKG